MNTHPDPDQFAAELITDDSALTGYLVAEVLNTQPPEVRDVLLSTSILEQVSAQAASELTGNERAAAILSAVARANGFVEPIGSGWYRYHPLFAEVLRLKLRREYPDRLASLHRRAARCYQRSGQLTDAVRHAAQAGDWQFAASIVIDQLAIGEIIEPRGSQSLAGEFRSMPHGRSWTGPQPSTWSPPRSRCPLAGLPQHAALDAADGILARIPAGQEAASRLAAAMIRLAHSRRTGDLAAAAAAAARAEALVNRVPGGNPARRAHHPGPGAVRPRSGRAVVRSSRCGGPDPPGGRDRRGRCRRAGRTSGLPWASGVGGGVAPRLRRAAQLAAGAAAASAAPASGRPSRTPAPRRLSPSPGCTWNAMRCPRRTAGSSRPTPPLT